MAESATQFSAIYHRGQFLLCRNQKRALGEDPRGVGGKSADAGYRKTFEQNVSRELGLGVDISARIKPEWEVLPKRWIVERSLAWLNNSRRLSKDYEITTRSAQAICIIAAFHTLLKNF